ncbi:oligosaccharide flippase family protein [Acinetobacter ursingii]|uniref:oligosaccharide flippase family protein n=2 Tax=Acinetobacter ursingii TaxID=108980 RepID=UPI00244AC3EC|nr:oligosaccharide flippase family protein [Acinetobacter ursingii]MDH0192416.1 oligosaccharide flippase family protein [Acinetobacter ursingii]
MNNNIKNLSYMLMVQVANYLLPLINIPILARAFGPENLGLITYITAITAYFVLLIDYSFNFTGVRRISKDELNPVKVFNTILTARCYLFLVSIIVFSISLYFINDLRENYLLLGIFFLSCLVPIFTNMWFLQAKNMFKQIAIFNFVAKLAVTIGVVILIKSKDDVIKYAILLNFSNLVIAIIGFYYICKKFNIYLKFVKFKEVVKYLIEDRYLFLSSIVTNLYTTTGIVILGALSTKVEVGYYGAAQKIIELAKNVVAMPIYQVVFPILARKFGESQIIGVEAVKKILPIFNIITLLVLCGLILTGYFLILILFGIEFLDSYKILVILSFGLAAVFYGILIGGQVMLNIGLDKDFVKIQLIVSILSVSASLIILPFGGAVTIALIWTLSEILISVYQLWVLKRNNIQIFYFNQFKLTHLKNSFKYIVGK